jgi:CHAD domain-containing protein
MPATFFVILHWRRQQKVFLQNLAKLQQQQDSKAIHDLRVAIKKMRAYLKLLTNLVNKIDKEVSFEKTEQLFDVLGKHRDIEIGLLLLQSFEKENKKTYTAFRFQLKTALQRAGIWTQHALDKYDGKELLALTKTIEQILKEEDQQKLVDKTTTILNREIKKLKQPSKHLSDQPHEVRKALKNVFYWISSCPKDFLINTDQLKNSKKTLDLLGDWQDHEMLLQKVKHFRKDFVPGAREEYLMLKELEKNIEDRREKKLQKAGEYLREFVTA